MRLIFIRHAEPDYEKKSLTPKGFKEAQALSQRVKTWDVDTFYTSPLPRTKLTAEPSLKALGREAVELPWMKEFSYYVKDPTTGAYPKIPWDFMPEWWTKQEGFYDRLEWYKEPIFQENDGYEPAVFAMREGLDGILAEHGYFREGGYYRTDDDMVAGDDEKTLVFFGHLGANFEAIGYLLGISPIVLQQTFFLAPTAVSVLHAEKRRPQAAMFRAQVIGCTKHLTENGEPVSGQGAFSEIFQL